MSAKRDKDFAGYMPLRAGSTIFANASISWSWGVAHLTSDCSDLALELNNRRCEGRGKLYRYINIKKMKKLPKRFKEHKHVFSVMYDSFTCPAAFCQSKAPTSPLQNCTHHFLQCISLTGQIQVRYNQMNQPFELKPVKHEVEIIYQASTKQNLYTDQAPKCTKESNLFINPQA